MSFIFTGIDHVQLAAPKGCETVARSFFTELLGWTEIPKPDNLVKSGGVWFLCGLHQVHIGVQTNFIPATKAHPAFQVQQLYELRTHLLAHNIQVFDDVEREEEGITRFFINDPFGNRLEFLEVLSEDSKTRFSNRVEDYVKYRPSYPKGAIDYLYEVVGMTSDSNIADIGAGTGLFTKLILERESYVTSVEPNQAMREASLKMLSNETRFSSIDGSAEASNVPSHSIDFIVSAQAFHWFDKAAAQIEFRRILKAGGKVALIWNSRLTKGTTFLEQYELLLNKFGKDYAKINHTNSSGLKLEAFFKEGNMKLAKFNNSQVVDFTGLSGRLLSASYIPVAGQPGHEPMMVELRNLFEKCKQDGKVSIDYETEIYWGEV